MCYPRYIVPFKSIQTLAFAAVLPIISLSVCEPTKAESPYDAVLVTDRPAYTLYEPPVAVAFEKYFSSTNGLPVMIYLHGSFELDGHRYDPFCKEVARAGYVVVVPHFDALFSNRRDWYLDARSMTFGALLELSRLPWESGGIGNYRRNTAQIAFAGHSVGGMFALKMANEFAILSPFTGIGRPRALILHDPGGFAFGGTAIMQDSRTWLDNLSSIPADVQLMILASVDAYLAEEREHYDGDAFMFGNSCFAGIWTRAWRRTNVLTEGKHFFLVPGGHNAVSWGYWLHGTPYVNLTIEALDAALNRGPRVTRIRRDAWNASTTLSNPAFTVQPYAGEILNPFENFR